MRKLIWLATAIVLAIWSGLAWLLHAAVGLGGSLAAGNADLLPVPPEFVEWASWLAVFGTGAAEWIIIGLWGLGALVVLSIGFLGGRLLEYRRSSIPVSR